MVTGKCMWTWAEARTVTVFSWGLQEAFGPTLRRGQRAKRSRFGGHQSCVDCVQLSRVASGTFALAELKFVPVQ